MESIFIDQATLNGTRPNSPSGVKPAHGVVTKLPATVRDAFALNWQHCGPQFCNCAHNRRTSRRFLQQNGVYSGHVSGVFCSSCYADGHEAETDAIEGLCKVWTQPGRAGRKGILLDAGPSGNDVGGGGHQGDDNGDGDGGGRGEPTGRRAEDSNHIMTDITTDKAAETECVEEFLQRAKFWKSIAIWLPFRPLRDSVPGPCEEEPNLGPLSSVSPRLAPTTTPKPGPWKQRREPQSSGAGCGGPRSERRAG